MLNGRYPKMPLASFFSPSTSLPKDLCLNSSPPPPRMTGALLGPCQLALRQLQRPAASAALLAVNAAYGALACDASSCAPSPTHPTRLSR